MDDLMFSKRLKALRTEKGYSQEQMSALLNISRSRLSMYEQGKREPCFSILIDIADFFNVSIDYLLGRTNTK